MVYRDENIKALTALLVISGLWTFFAGLSMTYWSSWFALTWLPITGIWIAIGVAIILIGLFTLWVGYAVWSEAREKWTWEASWIAAILGLLAFPIGTILSVIIIFLLLKPEVKRQLRAT